ncbi:MAG: amino acid adenylation domain-containing protein [Leptospirales bacterium]
MRKLQQNLLPLSALQKDIAIDQLSHPHIPIYNIGAWLKIEGEINTEVFKDATCKVIEANDSLHIVFRKHNILPLQEFQKPKKFNYNFIDFSNSPDPESHTHQYMHTEFVRPFALYDNHLYRYSLVKTSDTCYYFLTVQHHIIMDGFSNSLVFLQTGDLYRKLTNLENIDDELTKRPSYKKFITEEIQYLKSEKFSKSQEFWKNEFTTLPQRVIQQNHEEPGSAESFRGSVFSYPLSLEQYNRWREFSSSQNCTPYHLFVAALYIYFQRTNPAHNFVFGAPAKNRPGATAKITTGLFTNITPVKLNGDLNQTTEDLLANIVRKLRSTYRYQRYPIGEINKITGIRKSGYDQLFDIVVSYENFDVDANFNNGPVEVQTLNNGYVRNSLSLAIKEYHVKQGPKIEMAFNKGAFTQPEMDELIERLKFIIDQMVIAPGSKLNDFELVPKEEKQKILNFGNLNDQKINLTDEKQTVDQTHFQSCFHLFENIVEKNPESLAAICQGVSVTYYELNKKANRLAHYLSSLGIQTETFVGIHMDRSLDMLISILAVLKSGAAYVPLDPSYPIERIDFMIADSQAALILTQLKYKERFAGASKKENIQNSGNQQKYIYIDDYNGAPPWADQSEENPSSGHVETASKLNLPETPVYIIYTSGSTGKPKGVVNLHRGLSNLVAAQSKVFNIKPGSRILQFTSLSFDVAASDIFTTLCVGATLVLETAENILPGTPLANTIKKFEVTHIAMPPSSLTVMPPLAENDLASLTTIITGGETPPLELFKKWSSGRKIFNAYGPTETTVCASVWEYEQSSKKPFIGRPLDNVKIYILDNKLQIVPTGVSGELYISGVGLARGYLNREELTKEKFIRNPFYTDEMDSIYTRLYKTGDMARYQPDGNIEFLGRTDSQLKIRGYRIELEEIEAVLRKHPLVENAVVTVIGSGLQGKKIAAYVLTSEKSKTELDHLELKLFLKNKLPPYMVPVFITELKQFPLTANGKIDKTQLPDPRANNESSDSIQNRKNNKQRRKNTAIENKLIVILKKAASINHIQIDENLFDAGLDSLNAIEFLLQIEKEFAVKTHNRLLIHHDTIELLANHLGHKTSLPKAANNENADPNLHPMMLAMSGKQNDGAIQTTETPFFCVTAGYGDIIALKALSQQIGPQRPFYILQPSDDVAANIDAKSLALLYLAEIQKTDPSGTYLLGGYSAGGIIAFEMAQQLTKESKNVAHVVMLGIPFTHGAFGVRLRNILKGALSKLISENKNTKYEIVRILKSLFLDKGLQIHMNSLAGYLPKPYSGKISIFEGCQAPTRFLPWEKKWKRIARAGVDIQFLAGSHDTFIRPPENIELAKRLNELFKNSQ